jgi:hypothetical protein
VEGHETLPHLAEVALRSLIHYTFDKIKFLSQLHIFIILLYLIFYFSKFMFKSYQFETMSMCTGCTDWKMQIPFALNQYFFSYSGLFHMIRIQVTETTLIIYGIGIERCVCYKCNADRWTCTCLRNGVWGGGFVVKVWFFLILLEQTNYSYFFLKENHNAISINSKRCAPAVQTGKCKFHPR